MSDIILRCVRCKEYLLDGPIQCSCGDRLCTPCFQTLSHNKKKFQCLECSDEVYVKDCFKDNAVSHQLEKTILECSGSACDWQGLGEEYLDHRDNCDYALVECIYLDYGCHEQIPRSNIQSHVLNCSFAPKSCEWCGNYMLNKETHLNIECLVYPQNCPNNCGSRLPRKEMESHMKDVCSVRPMKCEFSDKGCKYIGTVTELEEHYTTKSLSHLELTNNFLQRLRKSMESQLMALSKETSDLKSEVRHLHREATVKFEPVISAMNEVQSGIQSLQDGFTNRALSIQILQATSYSGKMIWKIPEVQRRQHEAKIGKTNFIYSAPFFTHKQGYKACLRLYFNGDGSGRNTHLSLFFTIMKGDYDALLKWPFSTRSITLMLLNQDGGQNITKSLNLNPVPPTFERPIREMNVPFGCPTFAPLSVLYDSSYAKEDTIYFKCEIDTAGIMHP